MARFLAITSRGLVEPLAAELKSIGLKNAKARSDAVEFEAGWSDLRQAHLHSRLATRFLLPIADFEAYNEDDLYFGVLRRHDFTRYITPRQTLRVEAHVRDHKQLRDQRFVAMKVKDAVVDQFRKKFGERPNVGSDEAADLRLVVRVAKTKISIAIDLTGEPLSFRGYRKFNVMAPLREHVAAALLQLSGWSAPQPLLDPFCGSGTILIEAARIASGRNLNTRRAGFAFERLQTYRALNLKPEAPSLKRKAKPAHSFLFGFDISTENIRKAKANAAAAGVADWISFRTADARQIKRPCDEAGLIVSNPPYGERLQDIEEAKQLMSDFSTTLKTEFKGWDCWVLSGNPDSMAGLRLKANRKYPIWNGPLECRLLHYPIR